ncbi:type VI secretion system tip protein TssI/VgrG [Nitrincola iocasae]|uniref:Type VI secretion system tip protein VgrG n=1 Tax=Nitrincola iocasae TaxID=2614693 RepID=A0A5J6LCL9_9GAMM|nr:type VI secretion system tip protein TssI/VgrG [Nitrincola iocasae]QEW06048.1 type VI secretion system tip protein VgrG [Nitrincola iocasae]
MAHFSQQPRLLSIDSPLGQDTLLLTRIEGEEALSSLFSFEIEMYSTRQSILPAEIVGKNVTLKLMQADDQGLKTDSHTVINGFVRQFRGEGSQLQDLRCYSAEVVPWLWFLTQTSDSKVFQHKNIRQIASEVFADNGFSDFEFRLIGQHPVRDYCVQYQESDFTFLSRLFEEEGIYYFFKHSQGQHILVLADHSSAPETCEESSVTYRTGSLSAHSIHSWSHQHSFRTGRYAKRDYDFKKPSDVMQTGIKGDMDVPGIGRYEQYLYPGRYYNKGLAENLTRLRIEHDEALHDQVLGKSTCRTFRTGHTFDLSRHDDNPGELDTYLLVSIQHDAADYSYTSRDEETRHYENCFVCMPASRVYRPPLKTGWPKMLGPQHARVVGPPGEEIYTDAFGRVKVQFPWDRYGEYNENSSCWVRVSHQWAGKNWGSIYIPRIGQEVIVDFYDGNPDRPIITGRVYNAEQMPPWNLPANKTQSGVLTRSSKGGTADNANCIRFEDLKGEEQLFIHAEKNQDIEVENDETHWVGRDREKTIDRDETVVVRHDRTEDVGNNETISIVNNRKETVGGNEKVSIAKNHTHSIGKTEIKSVGLARIQAVGLNETLTVGGMQQSLVGISRIQRVGIKDSLKVGKTLSIEAGETIELVCGASKIVLTPSAIHLDSPTIHILGDSAVNIDGSSVNINCGAASGASPEGPDEPDTASLLSNVTPVMAAGLAMFSGKEVGGSVPEASAAQLESEEGITRKERYEMRKELISTTADIPELTNARERLDFNNDNIIRAEAAQYVYAHDAYYRGESDVLPEPPEGLRALGADELIEKGLEPSDFLNDETGFGAALFESDITGETMLTFRGTTSGVDWKNNAQQGLGIESEQYTQAIRLSRHVDEALDGDFVNVGHSLGGGLASAAVGVTGAQGYTFNSAGLHPKTLSRELENGALSFEETRALIQSQAVRGEVLTLAQSTGVKALVTGLAAKVAGPVGAFITGMGFAGLNWLPKASGSLSTLPSVKGGNPLARHGMDQVVQGIEAQKQEDIQTISNHAKGML